ncbi:MAG: hypothetical protein NT154_18660 [Verrucomicrobia bacterium]|nr:hypothetical protein [Verrucomicrobiota bacterium]
MIRCDKGFGQRAAASAGHYQQEDGPSWLVPCASRHEFRLASERGEWICKQFHATSLEWQVSMASGFVNDSDAGVEQDDNDAYVPVIKAHSALK